MKIECMQCGKKYSDEYNRCPNCGKLKKSSEYTYNDSQDVVTEDELYEQGAIYSEELQKDATQSSRQNTSNPAKSNSSTKNYNNTNNNGNTYNHTRHTNHTYKNNEASNKGERKPQSTRRKNLKWILLGLVVGFGSRGLTYLVDCYKIETNPKVLDRQIISSGADLETSRAIIQAHRAEVIDDEWIRNYIPEGYQLIGIYLTGANKAIEDKDSYGTEYYVSYEREGKTIYQPSLKDNKVIDYVVRNGVDIIYEFESFYGGAEGYNIYLIDEGVKDIVFNYTQVIDAPIRGFHKGITYEVPLRVGGKPDVSND